MVETQQDEPGLLSKRLREGGAKDFAQHILMPIIKIQNTFKCTSSAKVTESCTVKSFTHIQCATGLGIQAGFQKWPEPD